MTSLLQQAAGAAASDRNRRPRVCHSERSEESQTLDGPRGLGLGCFASLSMTSLLQQAAGAPAVHRNRRPRVCHSERSPEGAAKNLKLRMVLVASV